MLKAEPNTLYQVYPSWAQYDVDWPTLKPLVCDPLASGCLDEYALQSIERKQIRRQIPETIETIDGSAGGGVIIEQLRVGFPGLIWYVLGNFAESSYPLGVGSKEMHQVAHVGYLLPSRALHHLGRLPKVYDKCYITFEHADAAGDSLYWVVDFAGDKQIKGLVDVPNLAKGFGLTATALPEAPPELIPEISDWFRHADQHLAWFRVGGGRDGIGYQFALVTYVGLHLRKIAGSPFKAMHLVGQMETKTRIRNKWSFHPRNPIMKKA